MRAILDANVLVAAALSPSGAPGKLFEAWLDGAFDLVVSPLLLDELTDVLARPQLAERIPSAESADFIELLRRAADVFGDAPADTAIVRSRDPDDDYLIALASVADAYLVSGDGDLLSLGPDFPIFSPAEFLARLGEL